MHEKSQSETPTTKIRQNISHTFNRTPHMRNKKTTSVTCEERVKLEALIRQLKNTVDFHLQATSTNRKNHMLTHGGEIKTLRFRDHAPAGAENELNNSSRAGRTLLAESLALAAKTESRQREMRPAAKLKQKKDAGRLRKGTGEESRAGARTTHKTELPSGKRNRPCQPRRRRAGKILSLDRHQLTKIWW
jgi:hypothetical protein